MCEKSKWQCSQKVCDGVCRTVGEGHYITFDGLKYSFPGLCQYVLVQVRTVQYRYMLLLLLVRCSLLCFLVYPCLNRICVTGMTAHFAYWWKMRVVE